MPVPFSHYQLSKEEVALAIATYYGTIATGGGLLAIGRVAYFLWGVSAVSDATTAYFKNDISYGVGSVVSHPSTGKTGAVTATGVMLFNSFMRQ